MLSRALSLATVTLLFGCLAASPVRAQNLEAGKSPSQIFAGTCAACHKSPRGLLKTVPAGSLPGFLRQHYTTSSDMASLLGAFLISNGATDTRFVGTKPTQQPKDAKPPDGKPAGAAEQLDRFGRPLRPGAAPQEAAKPDGQSQQALRPDAEGQGRNGRRPARPGEAPDGAKPGVEGQTPVQAAIDRGPDGRKSAAKQKLSKRGKGGEEAPKTDAAKMDAGKAEGVKDEPGKAEPAKDQPAKDEATSSDTAKTEDNKSDTSKPAGQAKSDTAKPEAAKSETAKVDPPKENGGGESTALRPDPVPPVTPAPKSTDADTRPVQTASPSPSAGSIGPAEPAAAPPAATASAPPLPPVAPAGPPAPPISQ